MRIGCIFLALSTAASAFAAAPPVTDKTSEYLKSLPPAQRPVFNETQMVAMASLPLSCIDHPQALEDHPQTYLWVYDDGSYDRGLHPAPRLLWVL
jgi:uncharacterized Zn-finger protein